MAITKEYTTEAKIEAFLGVTITAGTADDLINSAVKIVDQYTGRNFIAEAESYKYYNGSGNQSLRIDDCIEVTEVNRGLDSYFDDSEVITKGGLNGYFVMPEDNVQDGGGDYPVQTIWLRASVWLCGIKNHKIKAKWGFSEVCPDDVSLATTIIAGGLWGANHLSGSGEVASERIGNYSVSYDVGSGMDGWGSYKRALQILDSYKRVNF